MFGFLLCDTGEMKYGDTVNGEKTLHILSYFANGFFFLLAAVNTLNTSYLYIIHKTTLMFMCQLKKGILWQLRKVTEYEVQSLAVVKPAFVSLFSNLLFFIFVVTITCIL